MTAQDSWYDSESFDWATYVKARPQYPQELYDVIYQHHAQHCNTWDRAYDMGTGIGVVAAALSSKFQNVVASDPSESHVASARNFLKQHAANSDVSVIQRKAEDMPDISPGSVDLMTMAECVFYTDTPKILEGAAELLKPGGTFAVWIYETIPRIINPREEHVEVQNKLLEVFDVLLAYFGNNMGMVPAVRILSNLSEIAFPETQWTNVRRINWRRHRDFGERITRMLEDTRLENNVRPWESVENSAEDMLVVDNASPEWLMGLLETLYPGVLPSDICPTETAALTQSMKDAGPMKLGFSTSLILATKR